MSYYYLRTNKLRVKLIVFTSMTSEDYLELYH